ncbi:DUF1735 domain-containing protein [Chitinophagaceae bacterium LWZ2-11]
MNQYKNILTAFTATLIFASCMKDVKPNLDPQNGSGSAATVGLDLSGPADTYYSSSAQTNAAVTFNTYNSTVKFYPSKDTGYVKINVSYMGDGVAPQDITVTLAVDPATLTSFNANRAKYSFYYNWGADATMPATADVWSIPTSVVIPKGKKSAQVTIKLKNTIGLGDPYVIPIVITATNYGTISGNMSHAAYIFQRVNNYDGLYMVNGSVTDAQNVYTGKYPKYVELITQDATTVSMLDQNYGYFYYLINSIATGGATNLSGTAFRFDATSNKCIAILSASSTSGATGGTFGTINPNGPNQFTTTTVSYDPTAAFKINYTASAGRFTINDTYTYVAERSDAN